ncbi:36118_t:CDS:1, partial [Racocetra persica]
ADAQRGFTDWLLKLGEKCIPGITDNNNYISLLSDIVLKGISSQALIDFTYPELQNQVHDIKYLAERIILAPRNEEIDVLNTEVLSEFLGEETTYFSLTL